MKKRTRTLCLLAGAVVLLLVAYFGIRSFNKNQGKESRERSESFGDLSDQNGGCDGNPLQYR